MSGSAWRRRVGVTVVALSVLAAAGALATSLLWPEDPTAAPQRPEDADEPGRSAAPVDEGRPSGLGRGELETELREIIVEALQDFRTFADEPDLATTIARGIADLDDAGLRARTVQEVLDANFGPDEVILPEGARLVPRTQTWERIGRGAMLDVDLVEVDGTAEPYRMTLVLDGEDWLIVGARWLG